MDKFEKWLLCLGLMATLVVFIPRSYIEFQNECLKRDVLIEVRKKIASMNIDELLQGAE